jgi:spermidine synthase
MASKQGNLRQFREQAAANKTFDTRYYSAEIHKAAMVLPPFAAIALGQ